MKLSRSFILVLVFMISLIVFANDEDSTGNNKETFIYLFQASPGERFDEITLDKIRRIKISSIQDIRGTKKSSSTLFIDTDFQKSKLGESEYFSPLDYEYSSQPDNLKENYNFLLISTGQGEVTLP